MNRFLSSALGIINSVVAVIIIVGGAMSGAAALGIRTGNDLLDILAGIVVGLVAAALVCGLVGTLIEIRETLQRILEELHRGGSA